MDELLDFNENRPSAPANDGYVAMVWLGMVVLGTLALGLVRWYVNPEGSLYGAFVRDLGTRMMTMGVLMLPTLILCYVVWTLCRYTSLTLSTTRLRVMAFFAAGIVGTFTLLFKDRWFMGVMPFMAAMLITGWVCPLRWGKAARRTEND